MATTLKGLSLRGFTRHFSKLRTGVIPTHTPQTFSDFYVAGEPMATNTSPSSEDSIRQKTDIIVGDVLIGADRPTFDRGGALATELGYEVGDTICLFGVNLTVVDESTTMDGVFNSVYDHQDDILYSLNSYGDSIEVGINSDGFMYFARASTHNRPPLTKPGLTKLFGNITWSTGTYQGGRYVSTLTYGLSDPLLPRAANDHRPWHLGARYGGDFVYGDNDATPQAHAREVGAGGPDLVTVEDLINHINTAYAGNSQLYEAHLDGAGHLVIFGDLYDYPNPWLGSSYGTIGYSGSQNQSLEIMHGWRLIDGNDSGTGLSYEDNTYVWTNSNGEVLGVGGHDNTMSRTIIDNASITYQSGTVAHYGDNVELPVPRTPVSAPPHTSTEGQRNLSSGDLLVDLGYSVGDEIHIQQQTPSNQTLTSLVVAGSTTVGQLIEALSTADYGIRLSSGENSSLLLYSTYGVTVALVNDTPLMVDPNAPSGPPDFPGFPGGFG